MNQEMVKAEKRFANHKARLDILDENVRVLNWRQPGTQAYAIRAVMDGYHVYITGDLGSARHLPDGDCHFEGSFRLLEETRLFHGEVCLHNGRLLL